jgi:hypothetical protein
MMNNIDIALVISEYINDNFYKLRSQYIPKMTTEKSQEEGLIE